MKLVLREHYIHKLIARVIFMKSYHYLHRSKYACKRERERERERERKIAEKEQME